MTTKASAQPDAASAVPAPPENPLLGAAKRLLIESAARDLRAQEAKRARSPRKAGAGVSPAGMEAALAALAIDLRPSDTSAPSEYGAQLDRVRRLSDSAQNSSTRNTKPQRAEAKISAPQSGGNSSQKALSLAARWNLANGLALAHKPSQSSGLTLSVCLPASKEPQGWQEALAFAAAEQLPVLFALWRKSPPTARRASVPRPVPPCQFDAIRAYARRCLVPLIPVDGSDAAAVYRVAQEAMQRARNGDGPTIIECWAGNQKRR